MITKLQTLDFRIVHQRPNKRILRLGVPIAVKEIVKCNHLSPHPRSHLSFSIVFNHTGAQCGIHHLRRGQHGDRKSPSAPNTPYIYNANPQNGHRKPTLFRLVAPYSYTAMNCGIASLSYTCLKYELENRRSVLSKESKVASLRYVTWTILLLHRKQCIIYRK